MRSVCLPGTEIVLSRLSFGTSSLHRVISGKRRQSILASAFDAGFTHFDTAPLYGFGLAEAELGRFLKTRRGRVTVATKIGLYPPRVHSGIASVWAAKALAKVWRGGARPNVNWSPATLAAEFEASLSRLQADVVDLLLLHEPSYRTFESEAVLAWLERERDRGRIRAWGLAGEAARVCEWLAAEHELAMVLQVRDSLDRREADDVLARGRCLQLTYGYVSSALRDPSRPEVPKVIGSAFLKNRTGSVLVSTNDPVHLAQLARVAEAERGVCH
jgi:aryl-alcohol dehydrogenase-like predicted oxidoreductase